VGYRWLFFVYGPKQYADGGYKSVILSNFERMMRGEAPTIYGDGEQALDYVYVADAVDALVRLARPEHDSVLFNVGSGRAVSVNELTKRMIEVAASELGPRYLPPDWTARSCRVASVEKARECLGWEAPTSIGDGLRAVWEWMVGNHG